MMDKLRIKESVWMVVVFTVLHALICIACRSMDVEDTHALTLLFELFQRQHKKSPEPVDRKPGAEQEAAVDKATAFRKSDQDFIDPAAKTVKQEPKDPLIYLFHTYLRKQKNRRNGGSLNYCFAFSGTRRLTPAIIIRLVNVIDDPAVSKQHGIVLSEKPHRI